MLGNFSCFYFFCKYFKKIFQVHYQSVKRFGSRAGPTFCWSWSGSKLFAKVISKWQKSPARRSWSGSKLIVKVISSRQKLLLASKELKHFGPPRTFVFLKCWSSTCITGPPTRLHEEPHCHSPSQRCPETSPRRCQTARLFCRVREIILWFFLCCE